MLFLFVIVVFFWGYATAQSAADYSISAWAESNNQLTIRLSEPAQAPTVVHRRLHGQVGWTDSITTLPIGANVFVDFSVQSGGCYEYRLKQNRGNYNAWGFVSGALFLAPKVYSGTILLLIDVFHLPALQYEINRLVDDLHGEGWKVLRINVDRNQTPQFVKQKIDSVYRRHSDLSALLLLGRVPVPYSGEIVPDGHTADHWGAWPADGYYGSMNGQWTDQTVNRTTASRPENRNVPGDGKFDQWSFAPAGVDLSVGRVDMFNMPAFGLSETELLRRYLDKNHAFRTRWFTAQPRGVLDDNFGTAAMNGESPFSSTAHRNFPNFFRENVWETDYLSARATGPYLWAYGCGAGSYTSCAGVASSGDFVNASAPAVFNAMIGSYFGDWDSPNNLLRAPLAGPGWGLTNVWAGRPYFPLNEMAVGATIGDVVRKTMNATSIDYPMGYGETMVHIALMGDPTLRLHPLPPNPAPEIQPLGLSFQLVWPDNSTLGYKIYRYHPYEQRFTLVGETSDNTWTDERPLPGKNVYIVRSLFLQDNAYYHLSGGAKASIQADILYPGDVNADGIVTVEDFYLTAAAYGKSGTQRPEIGTLWRPYIAPEPWNDTVWYREQIIDASRTDANGDGTVNLFDLAVTLNFRGNRLP